MEATKAGFSHCLFMDDDASFHMENIARTYMFLAFSKDRRNAVAGAMINNTHKWAMWENGAWFDGSCHPLYCGTDLRDRGQVDLLVRLCYVVFLGTIGGLMFVESLNAIRNSRRDPSQLPNTSPSPPNSISGSRKTPPRYSSL